MKKANNIRESILDNMCKAFNMRLREVKNIESMFTNIVFIIEHNGIKDPVDFTIDPDFDTCLIWTDSPISMRNDHDQYLKDFNVFIRSEGVGFDEKFPRPWHPKNTRCKPFTEKRKDKLIEILVKNFSKHPTVTKKKK